MSRDVIEMSSKGNYEKTIHSLKSMSSMSVRPILAKYARIGVEYLQNATPVKSKKTQESWYYEITGRPGSYKINFCNSNTNDGVNIAILLEYGHATANGGWFEGYDYIDPAVSATFEELADEIYSKIGRY